MKFIHCYNRYGWWLKCCSIGCHWSRNWLFCCLLVISGCTWAPTLCYSVPFTQLGCTITCPLWPPDVQFYHWERTRRFRLCSQHRPTLLFPSHWASWILQFPCDTPVPMCVYTGAMFFHIKYEHINEYPSMNTRENWVWLKCVYLVIIAW